MTSGLELPSSNRSERRQRMIAAAARRLQNHDVVLVGVGMPGEAAILAQSIHAPDITLVYESGSVGAAPAQPPLSIGDPTLFAGCLATLSLADTFTFIIEAGRVDVAFVGAAEIDRYGSLNSTVIGDYARPDVRLPGSGGATEIVGRAKKTLVISPLERRRFPATVTFATSRPPASVELVVVTDRATLTRRVGETELVLDTLYEGETRDSIASQVGWDLQCAPHVRYERELGLYR